MVKPTENPDAAEPALPTPAPGQPEAPEDPAVNVQKDPPESSVDETVSTHLLLNRQAQLTRRRLTTVTF